MKSHKSSQSVIHSFSPFIFQIGDFGLRYYSLAYLLGTLLTYLWLVYVAKYDKDKIADFALYGFLAIVIGGRLGEVFFYHPEWLWQDPLRILKIWQGGMSFHGGFLLVALWTWWFLKKQKWDFLRFTDAMVAPAIIGVGLAKIGNFFNGELWGRPTDVAWCYVFPKADELCRHPSMLYQAIGNILVGLGLIYMFFCKPKRGTLTALFLIGYGVIRIVVELFWRVPDWIFWGISSGTWLSLPMFIIGLILLVKINHSPKKEED